MAINPHHTIEEINGKRCSVVEKKISAERAGYLKRILESSDIEVITGTDETGNVTIGVTNILFSPMYALYSRSLRTPDGKVVTPACWYQKLPTGGYYWEYSV
jgi:hypothetical protein